MLHLLNKLKTKRISIYLLKIFQLKVKTILDQIPWAEKHDPKLKKEILGSPKDE
jgi:hypothetical protein